MVGCPPGLSGAARRGLVLQLFINYKLKSVAYLPWRKFVYRALNTFIDDLFSFIVRMVRACDGPLPCPQRSSHVPPLCRCSLRCIESAASGTTLFS
eukprot:SAG25_NODE_86_length_16515_cov_5.529996_15_plen_96_part_00